MEYRREIDGLRALAVLPVILFHAGFQTFSGGFVGVDVFFVISGYLITTILIEDIENKRFSIVTFYERRARRILPALYFLLALVSFVATIMMLPSQLKDYGQSVLATVSFLSNFYFYLKTDYWAQSSEFLPLLNTWSLGVEEQYYILFPVFLFLAWRFGKSRVLLILVLMTLVSFLLSEWGWQNKSLANFYLAPTRAWELFSGAIAAFTAKKRGIQKNQALSILGLVAIVFAIFTFDKTTPSPSRYMLIPVAGTLLFILFAGKNTLVANLLSSNVLVGIGLISYSTYLWHQPILALWRVYKSSIDLSIAERTVIVLSTLVMAYFSYKFVELPFRQKNHISRRVVFASSIIPVLVFGFYGILMQSTQALNDIKLSFLTPQAKNLMEKLSEQQIKRSNLWEKELKLAEYAYPNDSKFRILFLGDSLSQDLYVVSKQSQAISEIAHVRRLDFDKDCAKNIVTNGKEVSHNQKHCSESFIQTFESDLYRNSEFIVLAAAWLSNAKYLESLLERPELKKRRLLFIKRMASPRYLR